VISGNAATLNISCNTWSYTAILFTLPLVEVGIVHNTGLLVSCAPRECTVALGTPHLITALDLRDGSSTSRAGAAILGEKLGSGDIIGIAGVLGVTIVSLHLMTVGTGPLRAETAFPRCAEESTALGVRALADKGGFRFSLLATTITEKTDLIICVGSEGVDAIDLFREFALLRIELLELCVEGWDEFALHLFGRTDLLGTMLGGGHEGNLAIEKNILAMFLIIAHSVSHREIVVDEFTLP
jgi:hypothetical protein